MSFIIFGLFDFRLIFIQRTKGMEFHAVSNSGRFSFSYRE
jgi:hypothetical protein